MFAQRRSFGRLRKNAVEVLEGESEDEVVVVPFRVVGANADVRGAGRKRLQRSAQQNFARESADVVSGAVIEVSERNGGNAHVARGGGLHGFANDLSGVGNRDEVEIFAEGADENWFPETLNGGFGLMVAMAPVEEGAAGIGLRSEGKRGDGAGDGQFVFEV